MTSSTLRLCSLNPCFNGICSKSVTAENKKREVIES